ncbi:RHS repeat-associated core domain-containing protein [Methylocaldum gracile subsp. desertum]|uniref:RHS repeat-associated core domain-containing protein n=1 Tax=Methylocaldum sp. GT1BW TaxID=3438964 RepID=UPI003D9FB707
MADALNLAAGQTYGYDELHRLTAATGPFGTLAYGYDATGNRQSESRNGQTTAYHYLPTDQRLQSLSGSVNQSFAYDATGNTVDNGPFDFAYGGDLRLRHVTQGGHSVADYHYWHYATGQRTAKIVNGRVTHFDYAPWGPLLSESVGDVVSSSYPYADMTTLAYTDYVYLDDLPLAQIDPSGAVAYLHPNHLGAPLVATNENGEVVWQANYEPFGQASLVNPSVTLNLRLPGQYFDAETGLYQNWHRDYDPSLGRYLQSDPIGLEGGLNTYAYVGDNPVNVTDPDGLLPVFRWRRCNEAEVTACKNYCDLVIGRPYKSCRARIAFIENINTIDYRNLPNGLSCSCEDEKDETDDSSEPAGMCR